MLDFLDLRKIDDGAAPLVRVLSVFNGTALYPKRIRYENNI